MDTGRDLLQVEPYLDFLAADKREPRHIDGEDEETHIVCHEDMVPDFASAEIDRLYGHLFCSLSYFEMAKQLPGASTYVARRGGKAIAVLLYTRTKRAVTVINEYATLDEAEIRRFVRFMFDAFDTVGVVSFRKISTDIASLNHPWHAVACTEDMVIDLPGSVQEYEAAVGKNMRRNIRRYGSALEKDFPSFAYRVLLDNEIAEQHIRDIVALSCTRMKSKSIVPRFTEEEIRWIVRFARQCGMVGLVTIDGRVCAGAIGFRIGRNYAMHVIAHDQRYNDYSLGILCYYRTICEGIARGGKRFHLLQGQYGYKHRLLARRQDIVSLDVYRSPLHALACCGRIVRKEMLGRVRLTKQWLLHDVEQREGKVYRLIGRAVHALRAAKRSRASAKKAESDA
jgi:CelD/BcsL family acetyltransferase involved in cellulose biosynthesis